MILWGITLPKRHELHDSTQIFLGPGGQSQTFFPLEGQMPTIGASGDSMQTILHLNQLSERRSKFGREGPSIHYTWPRSLFRFLPAHPSHARVRMHELLLCLIMTTGRISAASSSVTEPSSRPSK